MLRPVPKRPELQALIDRAKTVVVTDEELRAQCASFVYGNAPMNSRITKESALKAMTQIRITAAPAPFGSGVTN